MRDMSWEIIEAQVGGHSRLRSQQSRKHSSAKWIYMQKEKSEDTV